MENIKSKIFIEYFIIILIIIMRINESTAKISYLVLSVYSFFGYKNIIQSLFLVCFFTMGNPAVIPEISFISAGRFLVMTTAFIALMYHTKLNIKLDKFTRITLIFGFFILVHSFFFSPIKDISILKILIWLIAIITITQAWNKASVNHQKRIFNFLILSLLSIFVVSLPLLSSITGYGYLRNDVGFQGILNHPQIFGSTMAILGALSFGIFLTKKVNFYLFIFLSCLILIILSEARTAGFSLILAISIALILNKHHLKTLISRNKKITIYTIVFIPIAIIYSDTIVFYVASYVVKRADSINVNIYTQSRSVLIEPMIENIKEDIWIGIGYGIASNKSEMEVQREALTGLPLSVAVEKGVTPIAILEELGIFGFILFLIWLGIIVNRSLSSSIESLIATLTIIFLNLGEATLFSPGGFGLLTYIIIGWSLLNKRQWVKFVDNKR